MNGQSTTTKQIGIGGYTPICTLQKYYLFSIFGVERARNCRIRAIFVPRHPPRRVRGVLERFGEPWVK